MQVERNIVHGTEHMRQHGFGDALRLVLLPQILVFLIRYCRTFGIVQASLSLFSLNAILYFNT